ncbi:MAG: OmpA family protein [bacterium]|nr:OmpA family protein [bacterium]
MRTRSQRIMLWTLLAAVAFTATGCRYGINRYYDFRDMINLGVGATHENPTTGMWPPSLGVYVEATDFLQLGAITHNGVTAELDMRGTGVYPESRTRLGFLWWQAVHINQDYREAAYMNYFKEDDTLWAQWMTSPMMEFWGKPAKDLNYKHWRSDLQYGMCLMPRGYQYWEYTGAEVAICDPFLTHFGLMLRAGVDVSEASDFLLGWFGYDFKHDDMTPEMFAEKCGQPMAAEAPAPAVDTAELDRLKRENADLAARNQALEDELAKVQGELRRLAKGVEIILPMNVLFDTAKNTLRPEGKALLDKVAEQIRRDYPNHEITVQGNTDSRPVVVSRNRWKNNFDLGAGRSLAVIDYLMSKGLPEKDFILQSNAANKPAATNATPEGRQQNRRAVIVLRAMEKQ